jgi:hypothetical protein
VVFFFVLKLDSAMGMGMFIEIHDFCDILSHITHLYTHIQGRYGGPNIACFQKIKIAKDPLHVNALIYIYNPMYNAIPAAYFANGFII